MSRFHELALRAACVVLFLGAALRAEEGMTLSGVVRHALEHSPKLAAARVETDRREALAAAARSPLLPQLDLSASAAASRFDRGYPAGAPPSLLRFDQVLFAGGADLRWLAWDFRKTELELAAAKERILASRASAERRRQEIVFEVARLYLEAMSYKDLIAAGEARAGSLRSLLERTLRLVEGGRAVPADALKIRTRLAQVESDLAALRAAHQSALAALAAEMGFDGENLPKLAWRPAAASAEAAPVGASGLLKEAADARPELQALAHDVAAAEKWKDAARRALLPRVELRASATGLASASPLGFGQMLARVLPALAGAPAGAGNAVADWSAGAQVSFPLFDGGRRRSEMRAAQVQLEAARLEREQARLRVQREVRTAAAQLESARARIRALQDSVAESERVLRDERLKFEAGRSVVNFVLEAESALLASQSLLAQARRSASIAELALDLATGRLDPSRMPQD